MLRPAWRGPVLAGAMVGLALAVAFLAVHAVIIKPIWLRGLRGIPFALAGGVAAAFALARAQGVASVEPGQAGARPALPGHPGLTLGLLVAGGVVPFAVGGYLRATGAGTALWVAVTLLLLVAALMVHSWIAAPVWLWTAGAMLIANALPALFLLFAGDLVELDRPPRPIPIGSALFLLEAAAGPALAMVLARFPPSPRSA